VEGAGHLELPEHPVGRHEELDAGRIIHVFEMLAAPGVDAVKDIAKAPLLVDLRNVYNPAEMREAGFTYVSVGRI